MTQQEQVEAKVVRIIEKYANEVRKATAGNVLVDDSLPLYLEDAVSAITALIQEARIDENESLLSVAEHEIHLGDKCYNHEKHTPQCHACRKRKMYVEYSKDWKKSIDERINQLSGGSNNG